MKNVDNGRRGYLIIPGVFDGMAGVQGDLLAFAPNRAGARPSEIKGGTLDGVPVLLRTTKDVAGPFWTSRFQVIK